MAKKKNNVGKSVAIVLLILVLAFIAFFVWKNYEQINAFIQKYFAKGVNMGGVKE